MNIPQSLIDSNATKSRHPGITARIVADSQGAGFGEIRLTSVLVTFPLFIQAELNTYRVFSRNSASSRAIPDKVQIDAVRQRPFIPHRVYAKAKGMHSTQLLDPSLTALFQETYRQLSIAAANNAELLSETGAHKQHVGRILAPYAWQTVLITADEWENFFLQRLAEDAQPEINDLAWAIYQAMESSEPSVLKPGDWHIPFDPGPEYDIVDRITFAVANCARVSYTKHGIESTLESCQTRVNKLLSDKHLSPFEHVAQYNPVNHNLPSNFKWCWNQYRQVVTCR
jgi:hypothetical protein